jgi:hypothetical protein
MINEISFSLGDENNLSEKEEANGSGEDEFYKSNK